MRRTNRMYRCAPRQELFQRIGDVAVKRDRVRHLVMANQKSNPFELRTLIIGHRGTLSQQVNQQRAEQRRLLFALDGVNSKTITLDRRSDGDRLDRRAVLLGTESNIWIYDQRVGHHARVYRSGWRAECE